MLKAKIEAILFASGKPVSLKSLAKVLVVKADELEAAIVEIKKEKNIDDSGIQLIDHDGSLQLVTNPAFGELIGSLVKDEFAGELTRPQLETLSIICYRGPVTKPEIEQIRGVNCSLIIRNLLIRGLVEEKEDSVRLQPVYIATPDFVRHLGVHTLADLPEYEHFHADERIAKLIETATTPD